MCPHRAENNGSRPMRLISVGIFRPGPFRGDGALVRLEDDQPFAPFAHGPPEGASVIAKADQRNSNCW
jgi:hypothetical protein